MNVTDIITCERSKNGFKLLKSDSVRLTYEVKHGIDLCLSNHRLTTEDLKYIDFSTEKHDFKERAMNLLNSTFINNKEQGIR